MDTGGIPVSKYQLLPPSTVSKIPISVPAQSTFVSNGISNKLCTDTFGNPLREVVLEPLNPEISVQVVPKSVVLTTFG